jgi:aldose sugar dehydrogenase
LAPSGFRWPASAALVLACPALTQAQTEVHGTTLGPFHSTDAHFVAEVVAVGFQTFAGLAVLPDGRILTGERPIGRLSLVDPETGSRTVVLGMPRVHGEGGAGLIDLRPDPDFAANHLLYYSYSLGSDHGSTLAVERARLEGDSLLGAQRIFTAFPWSDSSDHYGGRLLRSGEYLFITLGDREERDRAQDLAQDYGKIVRLFADGRVPPDNPFVGRPGVRPEIWTYGHRNPQGLTLRPGTTELWEHEHGPMGGDEINLIRPGVNYGWPIITYGTEYDGQEINGGRNRQEGLEQPIHFYRPSIAPSGMTFYTGAPFPGWRGNLFLGGMSRGGHLNRLVLQGTRVVREERLLTGRRWRTRQVVQGPDGFLYLGVDRFWLGEEMGMLIRIRPAE